MSANEPSFLPSVDFKEDFWSEIQKETRPIVLYGMGNGADKLIERLSVFGKEVSDFFASDSFVRGQIFHGKRVLSLAQVKEKYEDFVILVSFGSHLADVVNYIYSLAETYTLYIPDMPLASDAYFDAAFYKAHYEDIKMAYSLLCDNASKRVFIETVWYKLTAKPEFLKHSVYFEDEKALCGFDTLECAVDVGAYRGDTLKELALNAPHLKEVYAVEPDEKNYKKLVSVADGIDGITVHPVHAAAWKSDGELSFDASGNRNAAIALNSANYASYEHKTKTVCSTKIDTITSGRPRIDYIKYDTEGVEREALIGTENTIKALSPTLLISAYHKSEDIFSLLLFLEKEHAGRYEYYLRRHNCIPAWDLNLIAKERRK